MSALIPFISQGIILALLPLKTKTVGIQIHTCFCSEESCDFFYFFVFFIFGLFFYRNGCLFLGAFFIYRGMGGLLAWIVLAVLLTWMPYQFLCCGALGVRTGLLCIQSVFKYYVRLIFISFFFFGIAAFGILPLKLEIWCLKDKNATFPFKVLLGEPSKLLTVKLMQIWIFGPESVYFFIFNVSHEIRNLTAWGDLWIWSPFFFSPIRHAIFAVPVNGAGRRLCLPSMSPAPIQHTRDPAIGHRPFTENCWFCTSLWAQKMLHSKLVP